MRPIVPRTTTVFPVEIESLAFRTDVALARHAGSVVEDRGDHVVVRTPDNPAYYWGNYLLLPHAPAADEMPAWEATFAATFPECSHRAYGVATARGTREDLAAFAAAGLETDASTVMTATAVHEPPRPNREATYRPLVGDDDWAQQIGLWMADGEVDQRDFAVAKVAAERRMAEAGGGAWWGAFLGDRLLSSMGLFSASPGLARFQQVQTHPEARGRGLAGTLVHRVSTFGFDELDATTLVMVADPDYLAIRIYRSVGFDDTETQLQAQRRPSSS
jgi:GNAT superfamily N-acetyltransferase